MCGFVFAFSSSSTAHSKKTRAASFVRIGTEHNAVFIAMSKVVRPTRSKRSTLAHLSDMLSPALACTSTAPAPVIEHPVPELAVTCAASSLEIKHATIALLPTYIGQASAVPRAASDQHDFFSTDGPFGSEVHFKLVAEQHRVVFQGAMFLWKV